MRRERASIGHGIGRVDPVRFGRTILPIGLLFGVGTAGVVGGSVAIRIAIAAVATATLSFGLYCGLCGIVSRYRPREGSSGVAKGRSERSRPGKRLKADGAGKNE